MIETLIWDLLSSSIRVRSLLWTRIMVSLSRAPELPPLLVRLAIFASILVFEGVVLQREAETRARRWLFLV